MSSTRDDSALNVLTFATLFGITYFAGAELGHALSFFPPFATFWPPSGICLAALLLTPYRRWWTILAASLIAKLTSDLGFHDRTFLVSLSIWGATSLEACLGAIVLRTLGGSHFTLDRFRNVLLLCSCTAFISAVASALIGVFIADWAWNGPYLRSFLMWWISTALGGMVVAPMFLASAEGMSSTPKWSIAQKIEFCTACALLVSIAHGLSYLDHLPALYCLFPLLLWIAIRFEVSGITLANFLLAVVTIWDTAHGRGEFASVDSMMLRVLLVQGFIGVVATSFLTMAAVLVERRQAQRAMRQNEQFYRDLFENMEDIAHSISPEGKILHVNLAWKRLLGYSDEEIQALTFQRLVHPDDWDYCCDILERLFRGEKADRIELRLIAKGGRIVHVEGNSSCRFENGRPVGTRTIYRDVTARKIAEAKVVDYQRQLEQTNAELRSLSITDSLTLLYNRRFFQQKLKEELERASRYDGTMSLLLIDVDHFKKFNDTYGHLAGDSVLRTVAELLRETARQSDIVARFGGEEFSVLLPNTDLEGAIEIAERLRVAVMEGPWYGRTVTVSVGVAMVGPDTMDDVSLIRAADDALYSSKQRGRNRVTAAGTVQAATFA